MSWIVLGEDKGKIKLVSKRPGKNETPGLLPKGSFLTVETDKKTKFILRVDESLQHEPYSPTPMIVDMDLSSLNEDRKCQNIVLAYRVKDISDRADGKIDFIPPQTIARRSSQSEIDIALGSYSEGPRVFLATIHSGQNQILVDNNLNYITTRLPEEMFFHQMIICGATGSGKTVAMKYLAQYFVEELKGAVLAVNVKDVDFLKMDKPSRTNNDQVKNEWKALGGKPQGIKNTTIYYPANTSLNFSQGVSREICKKITLRVGEIDPESLIGLLENISDVAAQNLPDIFRYWQSNIAKKGSTFLDFVKYFNEAEDNQRRYSTLNIRGDESSIQLHVGTFQNIGRNLNSAVEFFDNEEADSIDEKDILEHGKLSVINVVGQKGVQFGSVLLRHLLKRIVIAKDQSLSDVPILIIIDEVHQFYNTDDARAALGYLDTICRTGRSKKIGVIFSSQNPGDIPRGLSSVVNSKIYFKSSEPSATKYLGLAGEEMESLRKGFAVASIHELSQLRILKFPLSYAGVIDKED